MTMARVTRVEDLEVYQKLCELHIAVCVLTDAFPRSERFELTSQVRRSSNSAPANLAEKHSDRHVRNRIEGVNRARGEALETIHHLHVARLKTYIDVQTFADTAERYRECIRMLNGLERWHERMLPPNQRVWPDASAHPGQATPPKTDH